MNDDVKRCYDMRVDFVNQYYQVPTEMELDLAGFFNELEELGNQCADATEFEGRFVSEGYADRFNGMLARFKPQSSMSAKDAVKMAFKNQKDVMMSQEGKEFLKESAKESILIDAESDAIAASRKAMIEMDVFDDYTRARNAVDLVKDTFKRFKRKK